MINDKPRSSQTRRIHPVSRLLKPVQDRIGQLNDAMAFMAAFTQRNSDISTLTAAVEANRELLAEAISLFEAVPGQLPTKYHLDSRLADAKGALDRIGTALDHFELQCQTEEKARTPP